MLVPREVRQQSSTGRGDRRAGAPRSGQPVAPRRLPCPRPGSSVDDRAPPPPGQPEAPYCGCRRFTCSRACPLGIGGTACVERDAGPLLLYAHARPPQVRIGRQDGGRLVDESTLHVTVRVTRPFSSRISRPWSPTTTTPGTFTMATASSRLRPDTAATSRYDRAKSAGSPRTISGTAASSGRGRSGAGSPSMSKRRRRPPARGAGLRAPLQAPP